MRFSRPLARVHFGRLVAGLEFLGQLREGQAELIGTHTFGFLAEEVVTEEIELLAQGEVFSLGLRQRGFERDNARGALRDR